MSRGLLLKVITYDRGLMAESHYKCGNSPAGMDRGSGRNFPVYYGVVERTYPFWLAGLLQIYLLF